MRKEGWILLLGLCFMTSVALAATVKVITQEAVIRKDKRFFAPAVTRVHHFQLSPGYSLSSAPPSRSVRLTV